MNAAIRGIIPYEFAASQTGRSGVANHRQYWNWDRYADDPLNSPLFNGDDASMGGNGEYEAYGGIDVARGQTMAQFQGGGCVVKGPFKE
jgi:tyrosinase